MTPRARPGEDAISLSSKPSKGNVIKNCAPMERNKAEFLLGFGNAIRSFAPFKFEKELRRPTRERGFGTY
jgi:hypothetical protein